MTTDLSSAAIPDFVQVLSQAAQSYRASVQPIASQSAKGATVNSTDSSLKKPAIDRPSPEAVVQALLQAELAAKQQRLQYPFQDLVGTWRLCFTTGVKKRSSSNRSSSQSSANGKKQGQTGGIRLKKGFYLPRWTPAQIGFFAAPDAAVAGFGQGTITNQIELGTVRLRFTGSAKYLGKKNLLAFDFTQVAIDCFGKTLLQTRFRGGQSKATPFEQTPIAKLPFFAFFCVTPDWVAARGRGGGLALWIREDLSHNTA